MTTIATDGKSMASDGMCKDQCDTIVMMTREKVRRLSDGRIVGASGNSFDIESWIQWLEAGKSGLCPIEGDQFGGLILMLDGTVRWVDYKGRETIVDLPAATGSGQDLAIGAMEAGATAAAAIEIACKRDPYSGGLITIETL